MRLIDGDALIAWIKGSQQMTSKVKAIIAKIKTMPTADTVREWIPCSERLPEKDGRYLTTYPLIRDMKWVHILWYGEPSMPSRDVQGKVWYVSDEEYGDVPYDDVIAWMPLPKPYGERKESE